MGVLAQFSLIMAAKLDESIFHIRGWINGKIAIAVARSYSRIIFRARLPNPLRDRELDWDPELGIGLAHYITR